MENNAFKQFDHESIILAISQILLLHSQKVCPLNSHFFILFEGQRQKKSTHKDKVTNSDSMFGKFGEWQVVKKKPSRISRLPPMVLMLIYIIYRIQHCRSAVETMVSPLVTVSPMVDGPSNRCHPGIPRDLRDYQHGWFHLELLMAGWTWLGHTGTLGKCFKKRYQKKTTRKWSERTWKVDQYWTCRSQVMTNSMS